MIERVRCLNVIIDNHFVILFEDLLIKRVVSRYDSVLQWDTYVDEI